MSRKVKTMSKSLQDFGKVSKKKCDYVSNEGERCLRSVTEISSPNGNIQSKKCKLHTPINDQCPICLDDYKKEDDDQWFLSSCFHRMHISCMTGLIDDLCPLCRSKILNLPSDLQNKVNQNRTEYNEEVIEEQRQNLIRSHARINPQLEIILAVQFVISHGVPEYLIPEDINFEIDPATPLPPQGYIFETVASNLLKRARDILRNEEDIDEDQEDIDEDQEDIDEDQEDIEEDHHQRRRLVTTPRRPAPGSQRIRAYVPRAAFHTITFEIGNLPPMNDEFAAHLLSLFNPPDQNEE